MKTQLLSFLAIAAFIFSCSQNEELDEIEINQTLHSTNYIYKGKVIKITEIVNDNGQTEIIKDQSFEYLKAVDESHSSLMEVYGLGNGNDVYLFDDISDHNSFISALNESETAIESIAYICEADCIDPVGGGGTGGPGSGGSTGGSGSTQGGPSSIYSTANLRIYADSYLQKEIDYTSSCYNSIGTAANQRRMKNMDQAGNTNWNFRSSGQSCYPTGLNSANDKLSSLQVSPSITRLAFFEDKDYKGKSKVYYRRDIGFDLNNSGEIFIAGPGEAPALNGWSVVYRLKSVRRGFLGLNSWNDCVSSILLN